MEPSKRRVSVCRVRGLKCLVQRQRPIDAKLKNRYSSEPVSGKMYAELLQKGSVHVTSQGESIPSVRKQRRKPIVASKFERTSV